MVHKRSKEALKKRQLKRFDPMFQRKKFIPLKPGRNLDTQLKDTLRMQVGKCEHCGWRKFPEALVIHHIDKNRKNNHRSNLAVLCRNCHYLVHRGLVKLGS